MANYQLPDYLKNAYGSASGGSGGYSVVKPQLNNYSDARGGYTDLSKTGGVDLSSLNNTIGSLKGIGATGGYTQQGEQGIRDNIGSLRQIGLNGGLSEVDQAKYRGTGYDEFARTGGYTPQDVSRLRARATSTVPSMYDSLRRDVSSAGGSGTNRAAVLSKLSRDRSRSMSDAVLGAETGISDQIRQGRQYGITGMANQEASLQGLLSGNKLAGLQASGGMGLNLENSLSSNKLNALQAAMSGDLNAQQMIQSGKISGLGGITNLDQLGNEDAKYMAGLDTQQNSVNSSAASSSNARNFANALAMAGFQNETQMGGLKGMESMYGTNYAPETYYNDSLGKSIFGNAENNQNLIGAQTSAAQIPGKWESVFNNIGKAAGPIAGAVTGGFMPMGGSSSGKNYRYTPTTPSQSQFNYHF